MRNSNPSSKFGKHVIAGKWQKPIEKRAKIPENRGKILVDKSIARKELVVHVNN